VRARPRYLAVSLFYSINSAQSERGTTSFVLFELIFLYGAAKCQTGRNNFHRHTMQGNFPAKREPLNILPFEVFLGQIQSFRAQLGPTPEHTFSRTQ